VSYKAHKKVAMFLIYVREAHPARRAPEPGTRPKRPSDVAQPKSIEERVMAASACREGLKLTLPMLIDTMGGVAVNAYRGWPAGTAIVDLEGNLVFYARGPKGVQPKEADRVLRQLAGAPPPAADTDVADTPSAVPPATEQLGGVAAVCLAGAAHGHAAGLRGGVAMACAATFANEGATRPQ